ncbi:histone-lysine N-methyltransferase [Geopyxis carbonaria]|nr:histone-lysine N-methyltransferase [Geopyxis carbonaria]
MPGRVKAKAKAKVAVEIVTKKKEVEVEDGENEYEKEIAKKRAEVKAALDCMRANIKDSTSDLKPKKPAAATPNTRKRKGRPSVPTEPTRKSSRVSKKPELFAAQEFDDEEEEAEYSSDGSWDENSDISRRRRSGRTTNGTRLKGARGLARSKQMTEAARAFSPPVKGRGKVFGPIPGVKVGDWWEKRDECGRTGVHPPTVAGIFGSAHDGGAYSVAVSAGYPDDVDDGDMFIYTGSGGRELRAKNLRTAPQSKHQELVRGNLALHTSANEGSPVRVIRGFKAKLGPVTGYRYDGLYRVTRAYYTTGSTGFKVWKFCFEREPGQVAVDYGQKERYLREQEEKRLAEEVAGEADAEEAREREREMEKEREKEKEGEQEEGEEDEEDYEDDDYEEASP